MDSRAISKKVKEMLKENKKMVFRQILPKNSCLSEKIIIPVKTKNGIIYRHRRILYKHKDSMPFSSIDIKITKKDYIELENVELPGLSASAISPLLESFLMFGYEIVNIEEG